MDTAPVIDRAAPVLEPIQPGTPPVPPVMPPATPAPPPGLVSQLPDPLANQPFPTPPGTGADAPEKEHKPPQPLLHVSFVGTTKKDKQRMGSIQVAGMFDMHSIGQLRAAERVIAENRGFEKVEILFWKVVSAS